MEHRIESRRPEPASVGHAAFRVALLIFILSIVVLEFPGLHEFLGSPFSGIDTQNLVIQRVSPDGPNVGIDVERGDEIYAIDGERIRNHVHYLEVLSRNESFAPQIYTLRRGPEFVGVTVSYAALPEGTAYRRFAFLLVALAFLAVGTLVYLRRPDGIGCLFAANCILLAFLFTDRPSTPIRDLQLAGELFYDAMILLFPAVLMHFFLVFPARPAGKAANTRRRRIFLVYGIPAAVYLTGAVIAIRRFLLIEIPIVFVQTILAVSSIYFVAYIVGTLFFFIGRYRNASRAQRARLHFAIAGTVMGFVPILFAIALRSFRPGTASTVESIAALSLGFVPVSYAYAILKHGAIELNVVVRKSIAYAVMTGLLIALYYGIVQSLGGFVLDSLGVSEFVWMPIAVLVLAIVFAPVRDRVQHVVDRLFYRSEYIYKQEVVEFGRQLSRRVEHDEIIACFVERVEPLLNPAYIAIYTRNESGLRLAQKHGDPPALPETFPMESFLGRYFSRYKTPLLTEYLDPTWERRRLDPDSHQFLTIDRLAACVPIVAYDEFLGLVLLAEKQSGLAYRTEDGELLHTFAERLGLALHNADLLQSSLEKERLKSEVMLARDIQLSLLPEKAPECEGLTILGLMVSSVEMGGDYFDYFSLDDKRVAVAIGDVSGKGVPAAMLASSIQAVFKNLAIKGKLSPAELNVELNEYLTHNARTGQFATFFYGVLDLETNRFTFSNAGQCPALLVKPDYVDRLGEGGMVLGVDAAGEYGEGTVVVEPGDLLVLYTDGVTEQKDEAGEEYGEDRLISFLQKNRNLPVPALQKALLEDVVAFGNGVRDDDITSVILRRYAV